MQTEKRIANFFNTFLVRGVSWKVHIPTVILYLSTKDFFLFFLRKKGYFSTFSIVFIIHKQISQQDN